MKKTMINKLRKWIVNSVFMASFAFAAVFQACEDQSANPVVLPEENISYEEHMQPLFNKTCAIPGCHDDIDRAGGYSMTTWSNIVTPGIVDPYSPETSRLVWRIDPQYGFPIMPPPSKGYLTHNEMNAIETWIAEGAERN
jgi:hypothetical protein